jgi:hypothetical protein
LVDDWQALVEDHKRRGIGRGAQAYKVGKYLRFKPADVFAWLEAKADEV